MRSFESKPTPWSKHEESAGHHARAKIGEVDTLIKLTPRKKAVDQVELKFQKHLSERRMVKATQ